MDIWIRSQDKQELIKIDYIEANMGRIFIQYGTFRRCVGTYATQERALKILDEIQKKMVEKYLLKEVEHINYGNMDDLRKYYKRKEINFVEVPNGIELEPINKDILVYEMPEE